jgi:hypothetical protein
VAPPLGEIDGVVTEDWRPVEGASVADQGSGLCVRTDASGAYQLVGLSPGLASLSVTRGGSEVASGRVEVVADRPAIADFEVVSKTSDRRGASPASRARVLPATVTLPSRGRQVGTIRGSVVDEGGRPVARAVVLFHGKPVARTDAGGGFYLARVSAGSVRIEVRTARWRAEAVVRVETNAVASPLFHPSPAPIAPAATTTGAVNLTSVVSVRGRTVDEQGQPIANVRVSLLPSGSSRGVTAWSGGDGVYELAPVSPGTYNLVAGRTGFKSAAGPMELGRRRGVVDATDLRLARIRVAIRGTVEDRNSHPVSGSVLVLRGGRQVATSSCRNGYFEVASLEPGLFELVFRSPNGAVGRKLVEVISGQIVTIRIVLAPNVVEMGKPTR